ncbi:methyl-accepting chemotaxis protein [Pseudoalteromonas sp. L23]|uniref:methyl-accepting chemotaxis protein n=1 Tax=unclassified Pseudoalteromonas TaxID=194690 RepID=UPI001F215952|nr:MULTISPECIES: methyl-accepting chemotaxis protein [unclassified Pseudoalteromonas]MCF2828876.1 methyl-accepting chemotaxis protein [Pseudoalteromonas sp. OF5H-5]MCF2833492.1 methyl-accepting chemotaxis protein [Pseudoalteromonas sp. DL2-H6]MCF2925796.1 methyl-accepting chemotaxis protein [Pseudoalteromonas sp. DL2-H1]MCF7515712.1 methyl-accepting chemotaxis protein [Pseudoalteromonas sp. L7]MCF7527754.1 methyl-accepting chemotaxis protein [Pseudoalteromonas sp. L23]
MLSKLRLSQQLSTSFGVMIVLMVALSSVAYVGLNGGYSNFVEYRSLARASNLASTLEANLLSLRINVLNYLKQQSKDDIEQFEQKVRLLHDELAEAKEALSQKESKQLIEKSETALVTYETAFREIMALYGRRNTVVHDGLDKIGPQMRKNISQLIESSIDMSDFEGLAAATHMQEKLLLGRLFVTKFLVSNQLNDYNRAMDELKQEKMFLTQSKSRFMNENAKNLLLDIEQSGERYLDGVREVQDIITERNRLITEVLNINGQNIAEHLARVKESIKERQDELGPIAQSESRKTVTVIIAVSVVVILLGCFLSWYITRLIKAPIGGEPKEIAEVASRIASGDLTIQFDRGESVSGIYLAMRDMADKLKAIIAEIQSSTHALSSSSETLSAITSQSKQGADNQMEQLSHSAVSMNEMAATIAEITQSAQLAADAATDADSQSNSGVQVVVATQQAMEGLVGKIENVSKTIENLEQETESVGSILDVIRGIAEQTNLLALNAAIEAARAGEQGRGFAVVADEVRSLASRTQKSTDEIQEMISKLQNEAKRSVGMMRDNVKDAKDTADKSAKTDEVLQAISSSVSTIKDMNLQIASASEEQNTVTQQLSQSVTEISETAQETATGAERASDEALSLLSLSRTLDKSVSSFRL